MDPNSDDDAQVLTLEQARFAAIAQGWPAMYIALAGVLVAVAVVHIPLAPWWAWAMCPLFLIPKGVLWLRTWMGRLDPVPPPDYCRRALRTLNVEVIYCVGAIVAWEVWLTRWGTPASLTLLALCMGGQTVFILFGLLHLRIPSIVAAGFCLVGMILAASAGLPGDGVRSFLISVVVFLVGGMSGLSFLAFQTGRTFNNLVLSRLSLAHKNARIEALGAETLRIANTDMLTEIGNRRRCFHQLDHALADAKRTGAPVSFGVIDLDGFKGVNDTNGHLVGDRLLTAMAERLKRNLAPHGEVFRLGGDEFAFIVLGKDRPDDLLAIGDAIMASVRQPLHIDGLKLMLGCSVGFASFPRTAATETELYDRADYVLYQAKRTGRGRTIVFDEDHRVAVEAAGRIEAALRAADLDAELTLAFQPIVDPASGRTIMLEALPRWHSPTLGPVPAERFLPVAEQSGLITALTPILLTKALAAVRHWPGGLRVSLDVSKHDIITPDRVANLVAILQQSGVAPDRVVFEIAASSLAREADNAALGFRQLRQAGAGLVLDDVAVGRTNFGALPRLGVEMVKVVGDDAASTATRLVAALARELSIACVGCGIDTRDQYDGAARATGILMQGAYLAPPMDESAVGAFLAGNADATRRMSA